MRTPITVRSESFDIESIQPKIDEARTAFANYLDGVPRKSTKSKHGLMGPIGKIFSEIKSGRRDPASLKGYAIRIQEIASGTPNQQTLANLASGIDLLVALLAAAPMAFHDLILSRLDYGLYYELRLRQLAGWEDRRQKWVSYLQQKYGNAAALASAWEEPERPFDELYLPKKSEASRNKKATARQKDIADFWLSQGANVLEEEEE